MTVKYANVVTGKHFVIPSALCFLSVLTRVKMTDIGVFLNPRWGCAPGSHRPGGNKELRGWGGKKKWTSYTRFPMAQASALQTEISVDPDSGCVEMLSAGTASEITIRPELTNFKILICKHMDIRRISYDTSSLSRTRFIRNMFGCEVWEITQAEFSFTFFFDCLSLNFMHRGWTKWWVWFNIWKKKRFNIPN